MSCIPSYLQQSYATAEDWSLQSVMLEEGHLQQLKVDTQIKPQHFEQYEGEAVFISAGCPHQVRQGLAPGGVSIIAKALCYSQRMEVLLLGPLGVLRAAPR